MKNRSGAEGRPTRFGRAAQWKRTFLGQKGELPRTGPMGGEGAQRGPLSNGKEKQLGVVEGGAEEEVLESIENRGGEGVSWGASQFLGIVPEGGEEFLRGGKELGTEKQPTSERP